MKTKIWYCSCIIALGIMGCGPRLPKDSIHISPASIVIPSPQDYDCFIKHGGTSVSNNRKVIVIVTVITSYYDNGSRRMIELSNQTVTSNPTTSSFPITVSQMNVPDDGHLFTVEVHMYSNECSECANGWGDQQEPTGPCASSSYTNPTTGVTTYYAAKPRWMIALNNLSVYSPTINVPIVKRISNLPNTCGCPVY